MSTIGTQTVSRTALAMLVGLIANTAMAQSIQGTATYRERMALPRRPSLKPRSRTCRAPTQQRKQSPAHAWLRLAIRRSSSHHVTIPPRYSRTIATLFAREFSSTRSCCSAVIAATPVITGGKPDERLNHAAESRNGTDSFTESGGHETSRRTYWRAIELAGKPTPAQDAKREAHLVFQPENRLSGSDGCNRVTGTYQLKGDAVTFGQSAATGMACINAAAEIERAFRDALKRAMRLTIAGDRLDLFDAAGNRVAAFTAGAQASTPSNSRHSRGTSWQLVKFQGSDGTTLTPDDRAKYTIEFGADGQLNCARRLQPGTRHLEVGRHESGRVRPTCADAGQVPRRIAARSDREAVGLYPFVRDQRRSSVPLADGRWWHLRIRTAQETSALTRGGWCDTQIASTRRSPVKASDNARYRRDPSGCVVARF